MRRRRYWLPLLILLVQVLPARASEAPVIESIQVTPTELFPNSLEADPRQPGLVAFRGRAPDASRIDVTVTDHLEPPSPPVRASVVPYPYDEPGEGLKRGDFIGRINVTNLGLHQVDPSLLNAAPTLEAPGQQTTAAGEMLTFEVRAEDVDADPVAIHVAGHPTGAAFDQAIVQGELGEFVLGTFTWTPSEAQVGRYDVVFVATDGRGGSSPASVRIEVGESSDANTAPELVVPSRRTVNWSEQLAFDVLSNDGDGDSLTVELAGIPVGASYDPIAARFAWTPARSQAGIHSLVFVGADGRGGTDIAVTVVEVVDTSKLGESQLSFSFVASSADGASSEPITMDIVKYAAVPGDGAAPVIVTGARATDPGNINKSEQTGPPFHWCHILATTTGACAVAVDAAQPANTAGPWNPVFGQPPTGIATVTGVASDLGQASKGVGSEISEVVVRVYRFPWGEANKLFEYREFTRQGPAAFFTTKLHINDFEPNIPGQFYQWEIFARDAWGRETQARPTGVFNVYPY